MVGCVPVFETPIKGSIAVVFGITLWRMVEIFDCTLLLQNKPDVGG